MSIFREGQWLTKAARGWAILVAAAWLVGIVAAAGAAAEGTPIATPGPDAGALAAGENGRPVCTRVGTRSEGWAWPNGRFIHWAKCKGVVPKCKAAGVSHEREPEVEGWYAGATLIAPARCAESVRKHP